MSDEKKEKRPTSSQMRAMKDIFMYGTPWQRVFGQSMHGGWTGVISVITRNKWATCGKKVNSWVLTPEGQAAFLEEQMRQSNARPRRKT